MGNHSRQVGQHLVKARHANLPYNARALSEVPRRENAEGAPQRNAGALSIRALEGSRWHHAAGTLMLWVLNVGKSVEGGVEGLVGSGESGRADWQQSGYGMLSCS